MEAAAALRLEDYSMQINFRLRPLHEVSPWGTEGNRNLHWFGLTDGWYWLDVDGTELLRYNDAYLAKSLKVSAPPALPYVDYYVVRLWEDVLDLLPAILRPVPAGIARRLRSPHAWQAWQQQAVQWMLGPELMG